MSITARCLLLGSWSILDSSFRLHLDRGTRRHDLDRRTRNCRLSQIHHPRWGLGVVVVVVRKSGSLAKKWMVRTRSPGPETWIIVSSQRVGLWKHGIKWNPRLGKEGINRSEIHWRIVVFEAWQWK
jgi:hypothetical protein